MNRRLISVLCILALAGQASPAVFAAESDLNFKIYSPPGADAPPPEPTPASSGKTADADDSMWSTEAAPAKEAAAPAAAPKAEPVASETTPAATAATKTETVKEEPVAETPVMDPAATTAESAPAAETAPAADSTAAAPAQEASADTKIANNKVLQGYIRVVPSGTKVPIIMDSAVDSDTSQEGDEFAARTSEDLNIDGTTVVPAGSVIKGRIAAINAPKSLNRSGSVALKFDTVTTPDNRQIPLVANLVARGGVVHARRGLKDITMDVGTFAAPTVIGLGIGLLAGGSSNSNSSMDRGTGALIGAAAGAAVGVVILCLKKGKKIDVRPGDELKIELAEDLRMPM